MSGTDQILSAMAANVFAVSMGSIGDCLLSGQVGLVLVVA